MEADLSFIHNYAFCGVDERFSESLQNLSELAEPEIWTFDDTQPNTILNKYIIGTFSRCYKQKKVVVSEDGNFSCFNTGLLTVNGNDILGLFEKNQKDNSQPWFFKGFKDKCNRDILDAFDDTPELATYTDNYQELYFNPDYNIEVNIDHILDDNWDRICGVLKFDKNVVRSLLLGGVKDAQIRIKRNLRLVVPQYYKDEIMYLVPLKIPVSDNVFKTMALAVEKTNKKRYRANTIFTVEIAYEKARLLMKPESNWLIEK